MSYVDENNHIDGEWSQANLPPHSIEAERSLLGGLMLDNPSWDKIADKVSAEDLYRPEHRLIFHAIEQLANQDKPIDIVTVQEVLSSRQELEDVGGFTYLISLAQNTPSAANITRYAEIIRERSILRQLAQVGTEIARKVYEPQGMSASELLDQAENSVFQIAESTDKAKKGFRPVSVIMEAVVENIDALCSRENKEEVTGVATGFIDLDKKTSGLQPGDLIIIAGRPSMGKTAFAMNIAEYVGVNKNLPVAIFSMEMGDTQLVTRMISSIGHVDLGVLKNGSLEPKDWAGLNTAFAKLAESPVFIDETPGLTALDIRTRARRLARQHNGSLGLIVIDYLQLMSGTKKTDNRSTELGEISRSLKSLAKELKVPIIALSQLSRDVEKRNDRRPMMSDLRESGAIEQDADLIMFMYREEYYNKDNPELKGKAECIIGKHRNGPTGTVDLVFFGQYSRFENAAVMADEYL